MDQKEWEERLDRYADRTAQAVRKGVHVLEDAFDQGKDTLMEETAPPAAGARDAEAPGGKKDTRRRGLGLVIVGLLWLLHSLGILSQPIFPILLIILGVYFLTRTKQ